MKDAEVELGPVTQERTALQRLDNVNIKFLLLLLPPLIVTALLVSAVFGYLDYQSLQRELEEKKTSLLRSNAAALASPLFNLDADNVQQILEILTIDPDVAGASVRNEDGTVIARLDADPALEPAELSQVTQQILFSSEVSEVDDFPVGELLVTFRTDRILATVVQRSQEDFLLVFIMLVVMVVLAVIATRLIFTAPLYELLSGIQETEKGRRRQPLPVRSTDAIGQVIQAYNTLLEDLRQEEEEAERVNLLFRVMADNSVDLITLNRPDGGYTYISPSCERITGYTVDELMQANSVWPFLYEEDWAVIKEQREKVRRGEAAMDDPVLLRFTRKDGSLRWIEAISQIVPDPNNSEKHLILGRSHDITELIEKQRELERSHEELTTIAASLEQAKAEVEIANRELERNSRQHRLLAENASDFISIYSWNGRYTYASPSAQRIYGYTPEELLDNQSVPDMIYSEDRKLFRNLDPNKAKQGDRVPNILHRAVRKDGEIIWLEAIISFIESFEDPSKVDMLITAHEVTELVENQQELERSRKELERANAEIEESHAELKRRSRLFQVLADNARDFIVMRNAHGRYTYCSPSARHFTGVDAGELMRKQSIEDFMDTRGGRALYAIHERFHRGLPLPNKPKLIHAEKASGERMYMEVSGALVPDPEDADENALMLTAHDVTDLIRNQQALTATTEELEAARLETEAALDTIQRDIELAKSMQEAILPNVFPVHPRYEAHGFMQSARQVGGDFYEFFALGNDRVGLAMADVSGKGVPAAFFMAISRTLLETAAKSGRLPSAVLDDVNQRLCLQNPLSLFVTMIYGVLDLKTGEFTYANGGHNPPLILHTDSQVTELEHTGNMMLGLMDDAQYRDISVTLKTGDTLFLYTDGITEAFDDGLNMYGEERLFEQLRTASKEPVDGLLKRIREDVVAFADGAEQSDDLTALALHFNAAADVADRMGAFHGRPEAISSDASLQLEIVNSIEQLAPLQPRINDFCDDWGIPSDIQFQINVSLEEYLVNLISYGYDEGERHIIQINVIKTQEGFYLEVLDDAAPFNPMQAPQPDLDLPLNERPVGGLGIHLIRSYMDQLTYQSRQEVNRFTMVKYVS